MCVICKDWKLGKLTSKEALSNIGEMINTESDEEKKAHYWEISEEILDKEMGNSNPDPELDRQWWDENHED